MKNTPHPIVLCEQAVDRASVSPQPCLGLLARALVFVLLAIVATLPSGAKAGSFNGKGANYPRGHYWQRTPLTGAEVVVRPDALQLQVTLIRVDRDPEAALAAIEEVAIKVQQALADLKGQKTSMSWTGSSVSVWTDDKGRNPTPQVSLTAIVELPLPPEADLLQRARWQVAMFKARDALVETYPDARKGVQVICGVPQALVSAPDDHRPALVQRWAKQMQEFVAAAQTPGAPLAVVDCKPPGAIYPQHLSLDGVKLTMAVECRVDLVGAAHK